VTTAGNTSASMLMVIDTTTNTVIASVPDGFGGDVAVTTNGRLAYVAGGKCFSGRPACFGTVSVFDTVRLEEIATLDRFPGSSGWGFIGAVGAAIASTTGCVAPGPTSPTPVPPVCGNGVTSPGEECDDGNTVSRDGCSSMCTYECGATKVALKLTIRGLNTPASDDTLHFSGTLTLPTPVSPPLDPLAGTVQLTIDDASHHVLDIVLPYFRWKVNTKKTKWTYADAGGTNGGIFSVVIQDKSTVAPGRVTFVAKGRKSNYSVLPANLPVTASISFNTIDLPTRQCGQEEFTGPRPKPRCVFSPSGDTLACK
jgi:cysteine-rich repeat protein